MSDEDAGTAFDLSIAQDPPLDMEGASHPPPRVLKRDAATVQDFELAKIVRAVRGAWRECGRGENQLALDRIAREATTFVARADAAPISVERVQDAVEIVLMRLGYFDVAKAYIIFRKQREEARRASQAIDPRAIADYIHPSKYARYVPALRRRELFAETVARVENMHLRTFADRGVEAEIRRAFDLVREQRVLPSMRSMQFGGAAIEEKHARQYNCSFTHIDRPRVFGEILYLLLCGCGVGYSVQFEHVERLPALVAVDRNKVVHHTIADTIEGWAEALTELIHAHLTGYYVEFNYADIRPVGSALVTSGGKAPGHLGLRTALEGIRAVLTNVVGRQLRPIEVHDLLCLAADAVLSGGVRRSAMIALFSSDDGEMMNAKTGGWYATAPWRKNANNSVVFVRSEVTERQFKRLFQATRQFGEPGFVFVTNKDYGTNPCGEIGLDPILTVDEGNIAKFPDKVIGDRLVGFAFCNLTTINAAKLKTVAEFEEAAKAATLIGTLQAAYTSFPYLGPVTEHIARRDALLGVSLTGMLDAPQIACDATFQRTIATKIVAWNKEFAIKLGINAAARTTCVKPEGTASLELGGVGTGHHAHHARRYIRRVTATEHEPVFQFFRSVNPHMCVRKPNGEYVIEFLVQAPAGAILKDDLGAIEFLEMVRSTQQNWVLAGTASNAHSPGLNHNVSNTVQVRPHEWEAVQDYLWTHRAEFTAVALFPNLGDKLYPFAPNEAITTDSDEARWRQIIADYTPVAYAQMLEQSDVTTLKGELACAGGACSL